MSGPSLPSLLPAPGADETKISGSSKSSGSTKASGGSGRCAVGIGAVPPCALACAPDPLALSCASNWSAPGWSEDMGAPQLLKDTYLVVVGKGAKAERLCDRRLAAGGRFVWIVTDLPPTEVQLPDGFSFRPPIHVETLDPEIMRIQQKFSATRGREWAKHGPDILPMDQGKLEVAPDRQRIVVRNPAGGLLMDCSGFVVFADQVDVEQFSVEVTQDVLRTVKVPCMRDVLLWSGYCLLMFVATFFLMQLDSREDPPIWRWTVTGFAWLPFWAVVPGIFGLAINGRQDLTTKSFVLYSLINLVTYLPVCVIPMDFGNGTRYFTLFWVCGITCAVYVGAALPIHLWRHGAPTVASCIWFAIILNTTLGAWITLYLVSLVYMYIVAAVSGEVANIALPFMVMATECGFVLALQTAYRRLVYKQNAAGEQVVPLMFAISLVHAFAESTGFVSMLCATIVADDGQGDYKFASAVIINFFLHLVGRHGWMRYSVNKALDRVGLALPMLRPTAVTKLHDEVKFCLGYPRFVGPLALLVSNLLRGKAAMFNEPAVLCMAANFLVEVLEDVVVYCEIVPRCPSPRPENYRRLMNVDPTQLYTVDGTDGAKAAGLVVEAKACPGKAGRIESKRSSLGGRASIASAGRASIASASLRVSSTGRKMSLAGRKLSKRLGIHDKPYERALFLHGFRKMHIWEMGTLILPAVCFCPCLMQLTLGAGFVAQICEGDTWIPPEQRLGEEAFVWPQPLRCYYN